jgi:phosphoglycolate phosphatase
VVFDFDGTLAETRDAVAATVNAALRAHGHAAVDPGFLHALMGLPLEASFVRAMPPFRRDVDPAPMVRWYRAHFEEVGRPLVRPVPGAVEVVAAAREAGLAVAIATSRESSTLLPLVDQLGLHGPWASIVSCDRVAVGKPHPESLHLAMAEAGVAAADTWMVGDTTFDIELARNAGVRAIGVSGGCHTADALRAGGADVVLDELGGLPALWAAG